MHVAHVELDWKAAITLADRPGVLMNTARIGGRSFTLDFAFTCDGRVTADGCIVYVAVATDGSGSTLLPPRLVEALGEVSPVRTARTPS